MLAMKIEIIPGLSQEQANAYPLAFNDAVKASAAKNAALEFKRLATKITGPDLLRWAIAHPNALAWLGELAQSGAELNGSLDVERHRVETLLAADLLVRRRFDIAALTIAHNADSAARNSLALAAASAAEAEGLRDALGSSPLSNFEINQLVAERQANVEPMIVRHREDAEAASNRSLLLHKFLKDSLRRTDQLSSALVAELSALGPILAGRAGDAAARNEQAIRDSAAKATVQTREARIKASRL